MAFDAIETPFGKSDKIIGGSATYVAYAASNFVQPVQQVSIVGYDFPGGEMADLKSRGVEVEGVEVVKDKKSFFWAGKYHMDMNTRDTLVTDLNVLADFNPLIPESYQGAEFLMLGNLMPRLQKNRDRAVARTSETDCARHHEFLDVNRYGRSERSAHHDRCAAGK